MFRRNDFVAPRLVSVPCNVPQRARRFFHPVSRLLREVRFFPFVSEKSDKFCDVNFVAQAAVVRRLAHVC